ncbi:MAG TPA: hypothetical protein VL588_03865, partial [Bdellovibrionota bacterium]|nr:hypothetical protein [Bdellovibrionota bacterium]
MNLSQLLSRFVRGMGDFVVFVGDTLRAFRRLWFRRGLLWTHGEAIGVSSTGIISLAAIFFGAAMGYEFWQGFHWFGMEEL